MTVIRSTIKNKQASKTGGFEYIARYSKFIDVKDIAEIKGLALRSNFNIMKAVSALKEAHCGNTAFDILY